MLANPSFRCMHCLMGKQVALIRGINVGTAKRIPMAELRSLVEELGYTEVRTLLNSGNVVFGVPPTARGDAAAKIQAGMVARFGVSARVIAVTAGQFDTVVLENPFTGAATDPTRLLVAFVSDPAELAKFAPVSGQPILPEVLAIGSRAAYLWCANGVLDSKLFAAANRLLGESVTTRNWATVGKLHALMRA
jgi:uncharacterized protein (DUF1697 family)